jgi:predicted DNA-binding transcriptional regulator AlpA
LKERAKGMTISDDLPRLALRPKDAAAALGIGERLLWEMTNRKEIPCIRIGRCVVYPVDSLRGWLADQVEGGPSDDPVRADGNSRRRTVQASRH